MATFTESSIQQSTGEIRKWVFDYTNDLPSGGTITGGTAVHIPPSGSAGTVTVSVTSPYVYAQIGPLTTTGVHYLDVLATFSNGEKSEQRIAYTLNYPTTAARSGMLDIIQVLRLMGGAGVNDFMIAGVPYWSDAQLQDVLDRRRIDIDRELLTAVPGVLGGGTLEYKQYYSQFKNLESGTGIFNLENANGTDYGTALWTADYLNGRVAFGSDTSGSSVFMVGRAYDVNGAAADVWTRKAGAAASMYDFSTDNHSLKRSQYYDHCIKQAAYYSGLSWSNGQSIDLDRSDTYAYR